MITNLDQYFSSIDNPSDVKPQVTSSSTADQFITSSQNLSTIMEESSSSMQMPAEVSNVTTHFDSDSNFDPLVNMKEENSNTMIRMEFQSQSFIDENCSNLFQFESNSTIQPQDLNEGDSFAPSGTFSDFNFDSNEFPTENSNNDTEVIPISHFAQPPQDFLITEESQDPEDMAKFLLGDISDSDNGSSGSDQNDD